MFFRESEAIAADHPELATLIGDVDSCLWDLGELPVRVEPMADLVQAEPSTVRRLLGLYEATGLLEACRLYLCPNDGEILEPDGSSRLACDLCDESFLPAACLWEGSYRVQGVDAGPPARHPAHFVRGHGLVAGIGAYRHMPALEKTASDARAFGALLVDPDLGGYPLQNVHLLLDEQATRSRISWALEQLASLARPEDTVIIFFSGHGVRRVGGFNPGEYLCTVDTDLDRLGATAISTDQLSAALHSLRARRVVVFLDACYSGALAQPGGATGHVHLGLSDSSYGHLVHDGGRVLVASSRPAEPSWEVPGLPHSLFTYHLLEGLRGGAANGDGAVRILDLFDYLVGRVSREGHQHPVIRGELDSNFVVVPPRARR